MMFCFDNSGKKAEVSDVTPLSNFVQITNDGYCTWTPRYELSVIRCAVDQTWFPFDEQICKLEFTSWLTTMQNKFKLSTRLDIARNYEMEDVETNKWKLVGT